MISRITRIGSARTRPFHTRTLKSSSATSAAAFFSTRCRDYSQHTDSDNFLPTALAATAAAAAFLCASASSLPNSSSTDICEAEAAHPNDKFENTAPDLSNLPTYTSAHVAKNNGQHGSPIWMSYGGQVYDVTSFVQNHPGGSERILLAAGGAIEPFWYLYRQHFASDLPMSLMENMVIGNLDENDQDKIDDAMSKKMEEEEDPYAHEPERSEKLIVHGDQPMNAEVPGDVLVENYLTPSELFYIRHHHPVPFILKKDLDTFKLEIALNKFGTNEKNGKDINNDKGKRVVYMTMEELKALPKVEVTSTLQCSGNRRGDMNSVKRTSGTSWSQGAISNATFGGVRLTDVLKAAGISDPIAYTEEGGIQKHLRMESLDGMKASICMEKATNPYGDVILAYEMNGEPLPRDHGFPLRCIVPGYAAVRNVKWLKKIEVSDSEAEGAWQQGLNYKTLPPNVTDAKSVNLKAMPSMTEVAVFSGIATMDIVESDSDSGRKMPLVEGDTVMVKAKGWAWAGGGRNIVRVDVTGDEGKSWNSAEITQGGDQRFGRAWAWVFWECEVPTLVKKDGKVELASKAVDLAFNSQPESAAHGWNVRGLGNNSWHHASTSTKATS